VRSLFTRNHRVLRSLLLDAKKVYKAEDEDTVEIYGADTYVSMDASGGFPDVV
jgi:hypothetical protein